MDIQTSIGFYQGRRNSGQDNTYDFPVSPKFQLSLHRQYQTVGIFSYGR